MVDFKGLIQLNESFSEDEAARVVASGRITGKDLNAAHGWMGSSVEVSTPK